MIGIKDDGITHRRKTLSYFPKNEVFHYREFVEDIGHKYVVQEQSIRKMIGEDELSIFRDYTVACRRKK